MSYGYASWMLPHTTSISSCCEQGVIFTVDTYSTYLISLFWVDIHLDPNARISGQQNKTTTPLWAEFCLTQRDSFGILWLMIVVHILCFRSNHWMNKWKNIKHTS